VSGSWLSEATRSCAVVLVDGKAAGTAVLVTPDRAFTCAHVVATRQETGWQVRNAIVQLRFGGQLVDVDAGGILIPGDDDLAVLTLKPAGGLPPPLPLWPAWRPPEAVKVFGFPLADKTDEGVWRDFTVSGPTTSGLVQLMYDEASGSLVGQSGGPVIDQTSGRLVGLLQEGSEKGVFDRYLPLRQIARAWPELRLPWAFTGTHARAHVESRGRGQRSRVSTGDLFCGRVAALKKIGGWLDADVDPGRVLVVSGQPGAGKSAVLSRAALLAEADHPGVGLVFHARQSTHSAFCEALAGFVGVPPVNDAMDLAEAVSRRPAGPLLVMVDALDEAPTRLDRHQLASTLKDLAQLPGLRVVVATRPLTTGSTFATDGLVYRLGATSALASNLIDLDEDPYRDPAAVYAFARALLTRVDLDPPSTASKAWIHFREHPQQAARLAHAIATRAADNFLVAALAATHFAERDDPVDSDDPSVLSTMPSSVGEALDKYLDSQHDDARLQITTLFRAVAHAKGDGITDKLWLAFARAISGHRYEILDLDALRASPLADFLLETTHDTGHVVTRLFHQALVDQLLPAPRRPDHERAILSAVLAEANSPEGWAAASPYALHHAAQHASDVEQLPLLLDDLDFVIHADPDRLISAILTLPLAGRPRIAFVVLQAGRRLAQQPPKRRAAFLSLAAAHLGLPALNQNLHNRSGDSWHVEWAHTLGYPHQRITGHAGGVSSVAVGRLGGRDVIVSGSDDHTVRIWDAAGQPVGDPLTGDTRSVSSVAVGRLGGRDVIVSGSDDHTVRVWDAAGQPVGDPLTGHTRSVSSVAVGRLGGRDVIVSGGSDDHTVRVWDAAGQPVGDPLTGHTGTVSSVAVGRLGGRDVIVSGGSDDHTVRVWDADGQPVGDPLTGHTGWVKSVAVGRLGGRDVIVSGGGDGTVRIWDADGQPVGDPLRGDTRSVSSVAVGRLGGRDVIVSGGGDGTVRVWDAAGQPVGDPLTGHTGWVSSVAVGRLGGRDVIVSGGGDGTVRVWDAAGQPVGDPLTGHTRWVRSVAVGQLGGRDVTVSGSYDHTVRIWDAAGQPVGDPLTGHTRSVSSVAVGQLGGRDVIVSGSYDHTVRIWDAADQPVSTPIDLMDTVSALTLRRGRLLVATGIALISLASDEAHYPANPK